MLSNREYIFEEGNEKSQSFYKNMLDEISMWWKYNGKYILKNTLKGLHNLWSFKSIIWKDRDYDHAFLFNLISFKLTKMSDYTKKKGNHTKSERNAQYMDLIVRLLDKVNTEFYNTEYSNYFKERFWFEPSNQEGFSELKSEEISNNANEYFKKYPLIYKRVLNGEGPFNINRENNLMFIAMNISHINHQRAKKLVFKILGDKVEHFWN